MFFKLMKIHINVDCKKFIPRVLEKILIRIFHFEICHAKNSEFCTKPLNPSTSCKH